MSAPTRLLIFAGSTRLGSFNRKLAHVTAGLARASGADSTARLDALLDEIGEMEGALKTHTSVLLALRVDRTG